MGDSIIAIYPGTFDPMTLGHVDIAQRATQLFGHIIVAVAAGQHKTPLFTLKERVDMARDAFMGNEQISVEAFEGLMRDLVVERGANAIVRGLRAVTDFDYEFQLAGMNRQLMPEVNTVFLTPSDQFQFVSSSFVREIAMLGGEVSQFVSPLVQSRLREKYARKKGATD
jgi:pantetheine-phosphate adenylyltransferase